MKIYQTNTLNSKELRQIALLHSKALDDSFINNFGLGFLSVLYQSIVENRQNIVIILSEKKNIIGFAVAIKDPTTFIKNVIINCLVKHPLLTVVTCLSKPILVIKAILGQFLDKRPVSKPELQFIAIDKKFRNQGLGKKIIEKLWEEFKRAGIKEFIVGTKINNLRSNNFYKKLGYKYIGVFRAFGSPLNYYLAKYLKKKDSLSPKNW